MAGRPLRLGSPKAAIGAGIAMLPEDRKAEGIMPNLSVRDNIVLAALPALTRAGFVSERRQDELVTEFIGRLRIKTSRPRPEGRPSSPAATSRRCSWPGCSASTPRC